MPRAARPDATAAMNGCAMPAPAPWANTKQAVASTGLVRSPETDEPSSIAKMSLFSYLQ